MTQEDEMEKVTGQPSAWGIDATALTTCWMRRQMEPVTIQHGDQCNSTYPLFNQGADGTSQPSRWGINAAALTNCWMRRQGPVSHQHGAFMQQHLHSVK
jgi:hypothetical protein